MSGNGDLGSAGPLAAFAEENGLAPGPGGHLPQVGTALTHGNSTDGAAHGRLPGGIEGTLALLRYERRSDDHTYTERFTAAITRVPESIGFAPYLAVGNGGGHISLHLGAEGREIAGLDVRVDAGVDEGWLTELFSPALCDWVARSHDDFGFELADGVLVTVRDGHLADRAELRRLCEDAAHLAGAIRTEALEDAGAGQADRTAAKPKKEELRDKRVAYFLPHVAYEERPPANVADAVGSYQSVVRRAPVTYLGGLVTTIWIWLVISIVSGGIYGLLLNVGDPLTNALIWEGALFAIVFFFVIRSRINNDAKATAERAFYEAYARSRGLTDTEPLRFAATHAEANLPGRPVRVYAGTFSGPSGSVSGALMLTGDGMKRGQYAALVAGPRGPTATAELNASAPGISAAYLDELTQTLLLDLATAPAPSAPKA